MKSKENVNRQHDFWGNIAFAILFASVNLGSFFNINIGVKITPIDIVIIALLFLTILLHHFKFKINEYTYFLFFLFIINFLIEMLSVIFIDRGEPENITLGVALLRNAILIFLILQLNFNEKIIGWIVKLGVFFSLIAIAVYVNALTKYDSVVVNPDLWDPGIFYTLDQGVIRLQGFREDPNFFFLVMLLPLFGSIFKVYYEKSLFSVLAFTIIMIALLLTFSRTGIILLLLLFLCLFFRRINFKKIFTVIVTITLIVITSFWISETYGVPTIWDVVYFRFYVGLETGGSERIYLWKTAWTGFQDSIFFGNGGRYVLKKAGNYAHNDYLEMLSSHGIIGFCCMMALYIYILCFIISKYKQLKENKIFILGSSIYIFLIIASIFFTIYYNHFIWFAVGLVFNAYYKANSKIKKEVFL